MGFFGKLFGKRQKAKRAPHLEILPILLPPSWPGGSKSPGARRLFGSARHPEVDPWVAVGLTSPDRPDIQLLPPGGLEVLSETTGNTISAEDAEQMACLCLDELMRREGLQIGPFADEDQDVLSLIYEDYAASMILLPHVLTHIGQSLGTDTLFIAIPTRATILFSGEAPSCLRMAQIADGLQSMVSDEARLTRAIFMYRNGRLEGMAPPLDGAPLSFVEVGP